MAYDDRLRAAMKRAGMTTARLADALGVSYQAVKKVLDGKTGAFTAKNNAVAAKLLGVNPNWLATGQGAMEGAMVEAKMPEPSAGAQDMSPEALQLAALFDRLPADVVLRARAWNAASTVILEALAPAAGAAPRIDLPTAEPRPAAGRRTGHA